jgi:signal peptidase
VHASRALALLTNSLLAAVVVLVLLLAVGPLVLPYKVFTVLSGSMEPAIPVGAEVFDWPVNPGTVNEGDVITIQPPGRAPGTWVTHRVISIDRTAAVPQLHTRGDANGAEDPWTLPANQRYLRLVFSIPLAGYALNALSTPLAHGILIALIAAGGALYLSGSAQPRPR